ncbi:MAG: hypothetical protein ACXVX9_14620, partial [Mycobacteriaceae bacterium]
SVESADVHRADPVAQCDLGDCLPAMEAEPSNPADRWALRHHFSVAGAVLVSGALGTAAVFSRTLRLHAVRQSWDSPFHAGAVRRIAELHEADRSVLAWVGKPA